MAQIPAATLAAVLVFSSTASAQEPVPPAPQLQLERFGIGAVGAIGIAGNVAAIRAGGPVRENVAVDVTVGHIEGGGRAGSGPHGASVGAQVRWLWHGRNAAGRSGYWLFGALVYESTDRTEIRWPNHVTTYLVEKKAVAAPQVGYGWDVLTKRGLRAGVEISTGSSGEGGPVSFVNAFVVWGPPRVTRSRAR